MFLKVQIFNTFNYFKFFFIYSLVYQKVLVIILVIIKRCSHFTHTKALYFVLGTFMSLSLKFAFSLERESEFYFENVSYLGRLIWNNFVFNL